MAQCAALRLVEHHKPGRIVFIGSWAGHRAHPHIPAYCVAKAGLRMLCQCMALEFAPHGILVNEVAPGIVDAGLSGQLMNGDAKLRASLRQLTPVRELIVSEDVARAVSFLCDPANRQMTGSVIVQDGGMSLLTPEVGGDHSAAEKISR
jgi:NAD(P)-dependent dehydrogenase (short-subunit alcohol dehydrogenase family)